MYLRVQPFLVPSFNSSFSVPDASTDNSAIEAPAQHLQFLLHLSDPDHQLLHTTLTQAIPGKWLNIWDEYDWVEDMVAEVLRIGVEVIGQEYVVARMGWGGQSAITEKAAGDEAKFTEARSAGEGS